jgi:hypothetical protein
VKLELRWIGESDRQEVRVRSRRRAWIGWVAAGIAALVAIAFAAGYLILRPRPGSVVRASILPPRGTGFLTASLWASPPVLSPDGTRLAFHARDENGKTLLYVRQLNSLEAQPLPGTDDGRFPFWSPDGREIGFIAHGKLKKVDADGGPPQTLCDCEGFGGTWSKTGVIVVEAGAFTGLLQVPAAGGTPQPASRLDASRGENSHRWPFFLPDGKHFLGLDLEVEVAYLKSEPVTRFKFATENYGLFPFRICPGTAGGPTQIEIRTQGEHDGHAINFGLQTDSLLSWGQGKVKRPAKDDRIRLTDIGNDSVLEDLSLHQKRSRVRPVQCRNVDDPTSMDKST